MQHHIFSVFDTKADAFLLPFFFATEGQAVRAIKDCVYDRDHMFGRHPADYSLFRLGTFEDSTGSVDLLPTPTVVACLIELVPDATPLEEAIAAAGSKKEDSNGA